MKMEAKHFIMGITGFLVSFSSTLGNWLTEQINTFHDISLIVSSISKIPWFSPNTISAQPISLIYLSSLTWKTP